MIILFFSVSMVSMKIKHFKFRNLDNLTKGIILFVSLCLSYVNIITKCVSSFLYIIKDSVIVKRISFINLLFFSCLLIVSFSPFFTLLSGELLLYSFPIVLFFVYFISVFLSKVEFDFHEDLELIEFFEQSLELSLLGSIKSIYILYYIMYLYHFLSFFMHFYFDKLLFLVNDQTSYIFICKKFSYYRFLSYIK